MIQEQENFVPSTSVYELIEKVKLKYEFREEYPIEDIKEDSEWLCSYSQDFLPALKGSIDTVGLLSPLVLDINHSLVDGHIRKMACEELGIKTVPVLILNIEGSVNLRVHFNRYRQKTDDDRLFEVRNLYKKYIKRQGHKNSEGTKYDRYQLIGRENLVPYKDDESLKKLEYILDNDIDGDVVGRGVINNTVSVELGHEFLKYSLPIDRESNYGFEKQLLQSKITIAEANKFIQQKERLKKESHSFVIPQTSFYFLQDCRDVGKLEPYNGMVQTLITSVPYYHKENYVIGGDGQLGHEKSVCEYAQRLVKILTIQLPLFKKSSNLFINITDTCRDGLGLEVPSIFQETMRNESPYKFKQQIYILKSNPKPHGERVKRPYDSVEVFLWYVIDGEHSKYIRQLFKPLPVNYLSVCILNVMNAQGFTLGNSHHIISYQCSLSQIFAILREICRTNQCVIVTN